MPRGSKHPHDPFPDDFGQWATAFACLVVILGWTYFIGELARFAGVL